MQIKVQPHQSSWLKWTALAFGIGTFFCHGTAWAQSGGEAQGLGAIAQNITNSFTYIGRLMIGTAYLAGIGFGIAAIFKFKQHKDNPTQIPVGTPIALLVIAIALVFLPFLFQPAGETVFGKKQVESLSGSGFEGGGVSALPGENQ